VTRTYRFAVTFARALLLLFFRRLEVTGAENIPSERGGILVSWHPNGLIDPALILTHLPRKVVFGARHGLFRWPLVGSLLRALGTVPIYRAIDGSRDSESSRKDRNRQSLDALASEVARGSLSALFPEGMSHDAPHLMTLKMGAASLFYRARELCPADGLAPVIIPVGLHYDDKAVFRSHALVAFHPPMVLAPSLLESLPTDSEQRRERYRALTREIERELTEAVHATESWELSRLMHRARKLVRAERAARSGARPGPPDMREQSLGFARVWKAYYAKQQSDPELTRALLERIARYDHRLMTLGLEDHELDADPALMTYQLPIILLLQVLMVYLLLPPMLLAGYLINGPAYILLRRLAVVLSKADKDMATIKLLGGLMLYPVSWLAAGLIAAWGQLYLQASFPGMPRAPLAAGFSAALAGMLGGVVALRYLKLAKETSRAVRVRLTRHRKRLTLAELKLERAAICDALLEAAEGLPLPGSVQRDGRVV
jgi:1-acyl-sn-glycerol-3-phosphate acyltransferase